MLLYCQIGQKLNKKKKKKEFWLRSAMCPVVVKMKGVFCFVFDRFSEQPSDVEKDVNMAEKTGFKL